MKRILVRAPNWIGDQILAYPFFRTLRARYPSAWIAVVCPDGLKDIQFSGFVDEVFPLPKKRNDHSVKSMWKLHRFGRFLRTKGPWDLAILLPNSFGSALVFRLAGAVRRRGYVADARGFLLNEGLRIGEASSLHRSNVYLHLLSPEGALSFDGAEYWKKGPEKEFDPYLHWAGVDAFEPPDDPYFVVAPGSNADSRRWDGERFSDLIRRITARRRLLPVVVGGKAEQGIAERFRQDGVEFLDFTARGPVAAHWKLFKRAAFLVANDSGLAHVGALCGCPVQIVWGAGDPARTLPIGPGPVRTIQHPVSCWPCEKNVCALPQSAKNSCLRGIDPSRVFEEVERAILSR